MTIEKIKEGVTEIAKEITERIVEVMKNPLRIRNIATSSQRM